MGELPSQPWSRTSSWHSSSVTAFTCLGAGAIGSMARLPTCWRAMTSKICFLNQSVLRTPSMASYARSEAKSWARSLSGYLVVLTTPFDDAGELDEKGLRRNVEYTLSLPGATGLYVGSNYQEFWTLTLDERKRLTEIVVETTAGRGTVMIGVTDPSA